MIRLHKLNGQEVVLNAELIETVESHGAETVIGLTTSNRIIVKESATDVVQKAIDYRKSVNVVKEARPCH